MCTSVIINRTHSCVVMVTLLIFVSRSPLKVTQAKYRVSIKSFPDHKHLLQETYVEYKHMQL